MPRVKPFGKNMEKHPRMITATFVILTSLAAIPYWILCAIASMGGPFPDYGIFVLLSIPIALHAFLISKSGLIEKAGCTLFYVGVVFTLCLMRYWEKAHTLGYGEWFGNTSLLSFLICSGFFGISYAAFFPRSSPSVVPRVPKLIQLSVIVWVIVILSISSYLYTYRQVSKFAISKGSYSTRSNSELVVFHRGSFSPRWCIKFSGAGGERDISEVHASLFGSVVLARGGNFNKNG